MICISFKFVIKTKPKKKPSEARAQVRLLICYNTQQGQTLMRSRWGFKHSKCLSSWISEITDHTCMIRNRLVSFASWKGLHENITYRFTPLTTKARLSTHCSLDRLVTKRKAEMQFPLQSQLGRVSSLQKCYHVSVCKALVLMYD